MPRRLQCRGPSRREDIGGEGIEDEGLCTKQSQQTMSKKCIKKAKPRVEDIRENKALRGSRLRT